jgi:hypothetical protein
VNAEDYVVWRSTMGSPADLAADGNFDGIVDAADYVIWRSRVAVSPSSGTGAGDLVPEPPALWLIALVLIAAYCARPTNKCRTGMASWFFLGVTGIVLFSGATAIASETSAKASAKPSQPYAASLTVVPPVAISDQVEFEVRVAVRNHTPTTARFELSFSVAADDSKVTPLWATPVEVKAHEQNLITRRFPSKPYVGKHKIAYQLSGPDGLVSTGEWPLEVVKCDSRSVPLLQIGWMDPGSLLAAPANGAGDLTESDLRAAIDAYSAAGIKGFIITYPEDTYSGGTFYYPTDVFAAYGTRPGFDVVGTILNQASKNGQHVFVGLGRGPDLLLTWTGFEDARRRKAAIAHSSKVATELWAKYAHEPSFYGWYLTHEANDIAAASRAYYNPMADFLRTFEADKPVLISPSGTPILSREILAQSRVDIFAYQDAVGSGYVPYKNTFDPEQRIRTLDDVYASYQKAHAKSGKHLWANLEVWQMKGPDYGHSFPPSFDRVSRQLGIEKKYVDVVSSYELLGFMHPESLQATPDAPAAQLFQAYRTHYDQTAPQLGLGTK